MCEYSRKPHPHEREFDMKKGRFATTIVTLLVLGAGCIIAPLAHSEGSHNDWQNAYGVNRVVRTNGNYYAAQVQVGVSFVLPAEMSNNVLQTTQRTNPYDNKPSAYLGAGRRNAADTASELELDGGLQYETNDWRDYLALYGVDEGWAAFISVNGQQWINPKVWTPGATAVTPENPEGGEWRAWRANKQQNGISSISSSLRFDLMLAGTMLRRFDLEPQVTPPTPSPTPVFMQAAGMVRLRVGAFNRLTNTQNPDEPNAFFAYNQAPSPPFPADRYNVGYLVWPWYGDPIADVSSGALSRTSVKRVVAMTRAGNSSYGATPGDDELDGSELTGTITDARVAQFGMDADPRLWIANDVNQARTGFDSQTGTDSNGHVIHRAYDRRSPWTPLGGTLVPSASRTIVTFGNGNTLDPDLNARAAARAYNANMRANSSNGFDPSRYQNETVRIYLGTATRPVGSSLEYNTAP